MPAKKLVVSAYLQYILIALSALLLLTFVRQLGGVLLTVLLAAVLAYVLNPLVRRLETWQISRVVAVARVFVALILAVLAALLVLIIPAVGQVQALIRDPKVLTDGAARLLHRAHGHLVHPIKEQVASVDQAALTEFTQNNAPSLGQVLNGAIAFVVAVFVVPIVATIATPLRYLRETLLLERWRKALVSEVVLEARKPMASTEAVVSREVPTRLRDSARRVG